MRSLAWVCSNGTQRKTPPNTRNVEYGMFVSKNGWVWSKSVDIIQDPAEAGILADAWNEDGSTQLGNSYLRAQPNSDEIEYNYITGFTQNKIRHGENKKFNVATIAGSVITTHWKPIGQFSEEFGTWLDDIN